jgi:SAM-dependent methyltransferase
MTLWDDEYARRGIPSSYLDEPSEALEWAVMNWRLLTGAGGPRSAIDLGCGAGRNSAWLARAGVRALGIDNSETAIAAAAARNSGAEFALRDLRGGLPGGEGEFDLALDIFVSKHLLEAGERAALRRETARVLAPSGRLLVSLAEPEDGFYAACPEFPGREGARPRAVVDPHTGIGSVLFSLEDLRTEMSGCFALEMAWAKAKPGPMHGAVYRRRTLATIWRRADSPVR